MQARSFPNFSRSAGKEGSKPPAINMRALALSRPAGRSSYTVMGKCEEYYTCPTVFGCRKWGYWRQSGPRWPSGGAWLRHPRCLSALGVGLAGAGGATSVPVRARR
jgi:hypothetical protein